MEILVGDSLYATPTPSLMQMTATEILKWVCPDCGLIIESMYQKQLDYNVKMHKGKHKK